MEIGITKCLQCGGELESDPRTGIPTCKYCGRKYKSAVGSFSYELQEIVHKRQMREFVQAEELCDELIKKQPESSEAYWQMLLAGLGVVYVTEGEKFKPTFFSFSYDDRNSIQNNIYYKNAIKYAPSADDKKFYMDRADELDRLLKDFFNLVAKENTYDIFISFKQTREVLDANSKEKETAKTKDYHIAKNIYEHLKDKYRVFFSPESIGSDTGIEGEKYEPRILKALQTSQAMILIGTQTEYLEAKWVKNEWIRFLYFIEKGNKAKRSIIIGYDTEEMPKLPTALSETQWPNFSTLEGNYFKKLDKELEFVRTTKGLQSAIRKRKIKADFASDGQFNFGYNVERVQITNNGGGERIQISATEERDLQTAYNALTNGNFGDAKLRFTHILQRSPNNAQAYIGRFCARIKAKSIEEIQTYVFRAKEEDYEDCEQAITSSTNEKFAWKIVDLLVDGLNVNSEWGNLNRVFLHVYKYVDNTRVEKVLSILNRHCDRYIQTKNLKTCENIFVNARKLFFEERYDFNIEYMKNYAIKLYEHRYFDVARKYFEELASVQKNAEIYLYILKCRVRTSDITKTTFNLNINPNDDASTKKPSELDLDEIIERIIICESSESQRPITMVIFQVILYQILKNAKNSRAFIETVVSCFAQLNDTKMLDNFLLSVANRYIQLKKFKKAAVYYNEILVRDVNCSRAHWGLLKCRLKVLDDKDLVSHKNKLMKLDEFQNALNCANNDEYEFYMSIYNGKCEKKAPNRTAYLLYSRKRRAVIICVIIVMLISLVAASIMLYINKKNKEAFYSQFNLVELSDGTYSISMADGITLSSKLEIPSEYNGRTITAISEYGFNDCDDIVELVIPNTISTIGSNAFQGCSRLTRLNVGDGVEVLDANSFADCNNLISLTLGKNITTIDEMAFTGCYKLIELYNLSGIQISTDDETGLGVYALDVYTSTEETSKINQHNDLWYYCDDEETALIAYSGESSSISIPEGSDGVELFKNVFYGDDWVTDITISSNVTAIGSNAFAGCDKLKMINYGGDLAKWCSIDFASSSANPMSVTNGIKIDGSIVKELTIPDGVTSIGSYAFYNCTSAYNLTIPESVTTIGYQAFYYCTGLYRINYNAIDCEAVSMFNNVFYMAGRKESGIDLIIGAKVKSIPDYLFSAYYFDSILNKANKSPYIEYITFEENSSCERIGDYAFYFAFQLDVVSLPETINYIGEYAFYQCARLSEITIPENVTYIGEHAFDACSKIKSIYYNAISCEDFTSGHAAFRVGDNTSGCTITIGKNVTKIPAYFLSDYSSGGNVVTIVFEDNSSCNSIGDYAFAVCTTLVNITIPDSVKMIGRCAFDYCSSLSYAAIGEGWYITSDADSESGTEVDTSTSSIAAENLISKSNYYWKRGESNAD